jgi:ribosome biogenesis GTPase YqeH
MIKSLPKIKPNLRVHKFDYSQNITQRKGPNKSANKGRDAEMLKSLLETEKKLNEQPAIKRKEKKAENNEKEATSTTLDIAEEVEQAKSDTTPLEKKCPGCGALLQCVQENRIGYVTPKKYEQMLPEVLTLDADFQSLLSYSPTAEYQKPAPLVCQRCWHMKHYNKVTPIEISIEDFLREISPIKSKQALIIKVVDIFDFDGSMLPNFKAYIGNNPVILAVNKSDLLPVGASSERVLKWIHGSLKLKNIRNVVSVHLISSYSGSGIKGLANDIEFHRNGLDAYVMGQSNVGKSSFINKLLDIFGGKSVLKSLTISNIPGTTLSTVGFPIGKTGFMYDTPGIMRPEEGIHWFLSQEELKKTIPKVQIKPSVLRLDPGTSFFIGGLARIDYISGPPLIYFTINVANNLHIHRVQTEHANESYANMIGILLTPPNRTPENTNNTPFPTLVARPVDTLVNDSELGFKQAFVDIVLHGLGWVSVTGKETIKIQVWYPEKCQATKRIPLMPYDSELGKKKDPRIGMRRPTNVISMRE